MDKTKIFESQPWLNDTPQNKEWLEKMLGKDKNA